MCNVILPAAATLLNAALTTAVTLNEQNRQQKQYDYQRDMANANAKAAQNNAANTVQTGIDEARLKRMQTLKTIASQKTALAANGVDTAFGSSLDLIEGTSQTGELDALMTEYNAQRSAQNYLVNADNDLNQANLYDLSSKNAKKSALLKSASSVLGGLGSAK